MRCSYILILLLVAGVCLAAGCAGYGMLNTTHSKNNSQTGIQGNSSLSLVRPWYVKALVIDGNPKVPVQLTGIQLTFHNNGSFSGFDSCNPYAGLWQADEKHITISRIISPMTYCGEPPGVMEQESEYFSLLKNASVYGIDGEDMVLSDTIGKNGLIFKQVFF